MLPNNQPLPAWMRRPQTQQGMPALPATPAWMRTPQQRQRGQAGYYQTGDNERQTISINGTPIRMGPNTAIQPNRQPKQNGWQQMIDLLMGRGPAETPGGFAGVRG